MNDLGIVLGRLSPPVRGRLQSFPAASWAEEFERARACGFAVLEWVFESERFEANPLWTADGADAIRRLVAESGVRVESVCADYFMAHPFFGVHEGARLAAAAVLERLIRQGARAGVRTLLVPVLEKTEIKSPRDRRELLESLKRPLDLAGELGLRIGLETELPAADYCALVDDAAHPALGIYYDVGNATARGFDIAADVRRFGGRVCGVHLKDRARGGPSVRFGEGHVDFPACFAALAEVGYRGPLVLQPATGPDYLGVAAAQLAFVRHHLDAVTTRAR